MKAVILAGGLGSRLSEETLTKPKPMVEIGNMPILLHIMKYLSSYNIKHFIICCGYKSEYIKDYFINYQYNQQDIRIDLKQKKISLINNLNDDWIIELINTGNKTQTGGRLRKIKKFLNEDEKFIMTYGDGLSDININKLLKFSKKNKDKAIITAVKPSGKYGILSINKNGNVSDFKEKPQGDSNWVNGGYFVLTKKHLQNIKSDTPWEAEPLEILTKKNKLMAFKHFGFWKPMDTLSDRKFLEEVWKSNNCPWKIW